MKEGNMTYRSIPYNELKTICFTLKDFVAIAEAMAAEFDEKNGRVTCEFSTGGDFLDHKMQLLAKMPCKLGYWRVCWCDTCFEQHGADAPFHCELIAH